MPKETRTVLNISFFSSIPEMSVYFVIIHDNGNRFFTTFCVWFLKKNFSHEILPQSAPLIEEFTYASKIQKNH